MKIVAICSLGVIGLTLFALGCGGGQDQWKEAAENVKRANEFTDKKMRGIADDKSLSDDAAYKKYLDSTPEVLTNLPKGVAPWWRVQPFDGGHEIFIHDVVQTQYADDSAETRMRSEREFIRHRMLICKRMLEHLKERKLRQVTLSIFVKLASKETYQEMFRAVMTQADVAKLANAPAGADVGGMFDPRGPNIGSACKVELNLYPELEYKKREK